VKKIFLHYFCNMETLSLILLAIGLLSLAMVGLALQILFKRGGKFPNTHVSGNKFLRSKGITCIQTYDKTEQEKARKEIDFGNMRVADKD